MKKKMGCKTRNAADRFFFAPSDVELPAILILRPQFLE